MLERLRSLWTSPAGTPLRDLDYAAIDLETLQADEAAGLLGQLVTQRARLQQHSELALELGDVKAATGCERGITANLDLTGRLLGQLIQRHEVHSTSILLSPDYLQLRAAIVTALRGFPEAARAVGEALHTLETGAAAAITTGRPKLIEGAAA